MLTLRSTKHYFIHLVTMIVKSLVKNLLWALRFPSFPKDFLGPYDVGVIQRRIPDSVACQIFYPAVPDSGSKDGIPYFRDQAVSGLADYYSGQKDTKILDFLTARRHPCLVNAEPLKPDTDHGYPVVLFSHGLGGCMEMYSELCYQIASSGMIVMALEHEDGSGCFAKDINDETILYKRPDDTPYSRTKVVNFRRSFLRKRMEETEKIIDFILTRNKYDSVSDKLFSSILQAANQSNGLALLGHSFGGASMALTAQKEEESLKRINSLTMLDPWAFALEDESLARDLPSSSLSILSEAWLTNPESKQIFELHAASTSDTISIPQPSLYYMPRSVHASFSDPANWLPGFVTKRMGLRGKEENRHETIRSCATACVKHIKCSVDGSDKRTSLDPLLPLTSTKEGSRQFSVLSTVASS